MITDSEKKSNSFVGNEFVSADQKKARAGIKRRMKTRPELASLLITEGYPTEANMFILYLILESLERIEKKLENFEGLKE